MPCLRNQNNTKHSLVVNTLYDSVVNRDTRRRRPQYDTPPFDSFWLWTSDKQVVVTVQDSQNPETSLKHNIYSHVNCHCSEHGCVPPLFHETVHGSQLTREVIGAYHDRKRGGLCISKPSRTLDEK